MRHPRILDFSDFPLLLFITVLAVLHDILIYRFLLAVFSLHLPYKGGPERTVRKRWLPKSLSTSSGDSLPSLPPEESQRLIA